MSGELGSAAILKRTIKSKSADPNPNNGSAGENNSSPMKGGSQKFNEK